MINQSYSVFFSVNIMNSGLKQFLKCTAYTIALVTIITVVGVSAKFVIDKRIDKQVHQQVRQQVSAQLKEKLKHLKETCAAMEINTEDLMDSADNYPHYREKTDLRNYQLKYFCFMAKIKEHVPNE